MNPDHPIDRDPRASLYGAAIEARDADIEHLSVTLAHREDLLRRCSISMRACPVGAHRPLLHELADVLGHERPRGGFLRRILRRVVR